MSAPQPTSSGDQHHPPGDGDLLGPRPAVLLRRIGRRGRQQQHRLKVTNKGAAPHTLAVEGTDLVTAELQPNATAGLSLASLATGNYKLSCTIPGHKAAGMTAELMVMSSGSST